MAEKENKKSRAVVLRSHEFKKLYITNFIHGVTKYDFRLQVFNERIKLEDENKLAFISDGLLILTPQAVKKLSSVLQSYVAQYEKEHGTIDSPDKIESNEEVLDG